MVARIQQALVIGCLGLAFAWLMIGWERSPVWAIVGALGLLAHLEKSSSTATAGPVYIDRMCVRYSEQ